MDKVSIDHRSWNMSRIRSKHTSPEMCVRKAISRHHIRYRLNVNTLPGKPDIVIRKLDTAIFINGCFWHQHLNCKRSNIPKSNQTYWIPKLKRNIEKQHKDIKLLIENGWKVHVIWECETRQSELLSSIIDRILLHE